MAPTKARSAGFVGTVVLADALPVAPRWRLRDVLALAKPRLSLLVIWTTAVGLWMAPGALAWQRAVVIGLATALVVGGANALNSYLERDTDGRMRRTRLRPLPSRRLPPAVALTASLVAACVAVAVLYRVANPLTALLSFAAFAVYGWVYTPMKRHSVWAVVVGAIPGAIPPLMGYTAVTGRLDPMGWALFGILFVWQLPHFLAIALYLKDDYARGGLKVMPLVWGDRAAVWCTIGTAMLMLPVSLAPAVLGLVEPLYTAAALVLGLAFFLATASGLFAPHPGRWARRVFLSSIVYLTLLLTALVVEAR